MGSSGCRGLETAGSERPSLGGPRPADGNVGMGRWQLPPGGPGEAPESHHGPREAGIRDALARPPVAQGPWEPGNERAEAVAASLLSVFIEAAGYCLTSPPTFQFV